jgi:hypothetical protein
VPEISRRSLRRNFNTQRQVTAYYGMQFLNIKGRAKLPLPDTFLRKVLFHSSLVRYDYALKENTEEKAIGGAPDGPSLGV